MSFPETRHTLIERIASHGEEADWRRFLNDYWGPVCRFAARRGNLDAADAEDVASQAFEALLGNRLLARWVASRSARLSTLLCSVVRNILSNRARVQQGRARLLRGQAEQGADVSVFTGLDATEEQIDAFYTAWVEDTLQQAVESLLVECHAAGKGDYFRVLYGRLCEDMPMAGVADALEIKLTSAENYYKAARARLAARLEELVRRHVEHYSREGQQEEDFVAEWAQLGNYLKAHGGLEDAVRRAYVDGEPFLNQERKTAHINTTLSRIFPVAEQLGKSNRKPESQ